MKLEGLTYIAEVVRRLKALLLGDALDQNYRAAAAAKQIKLQPKPSSTS